MSARLTLIVRAMHLLKALARRILLPAAIGLGGVVFHNLQQGKPSELLENLEAFAWLGVAVLITWAPLPLIEKATRNIQPPWQSPAKVLVAVVVVAAAWAPFILLLGALHVI
jgi:hypothetical protein